MGLGSDSDVDLRGDSLISLCSSAVISGRELTRSLPDQRKHDLEIVYPLANGKGLLIVASFNPLALLFFFFLS